MQPGAAAKASTATTQAQITLSVFALVESNPEG